jgi:hypothetical protein
MSVLGLLHKYFEIHTDEELKEEIEEFEAAFSGEV